MENNFLRGLWTVAPYLVLFFVIKWIIGLLDPVMQSLGSFGPFPKWSVKALVVISILGLIWIIGLLSKYKRVNKVMAFVWAPIAYKIPMLSNLIKIKNHMDENFAKASSFKRVVVVNFMGAKTFGFVTNEAPKLLRKLLKNSNLILVEVFASPPTSSFLMLYDNNEVENIGISVSQAFEIVATFGLSGPAEEENEESHSDSEWDFFIFSNWLFF